MTRFIIALAAMPAAAFPTAAWAASQDGNVEWNGASHIGWQDRAPIVPMNGEAFEVRFQSYRGDLTGAGVRLDDGSLVPASINHSRGPYDIWSATVPATASATRTYRIELTDGADTDYLSESGVADTAAGSPFSVNYTTLEHAPVGSTPVAGGVVFKVWSPTRTTCNVRGEFNSWSTANPLTKVGEHFIGFVPGAEAGDMYKYFFNNGTWNSDPRARRLNPTDNYNSFVVDPTSYQWQSEPFSPPSAADMVIYQLHVGSFAGRNDPYGPSRGNPSRYLDVADRVAHLVDLGVNTVMVNPINEFPGDFSGGYNPVSMYAWEWRLGTPDELKEMIDVLHANGIAVIHDIVWNHVSFSDNFLWNYDGTQLYFDNPIVDTPWGAQAALSKQGVRDYYLDSVVYMLDEFRMDGFRMDATDFMNIGANEAAGWSLMQELNDLVDNRYEDKIMIAEQLPDDAFVTRPTNLGGAGFDAQYWDRFVDDLRAQVFGAAFGSPNVTALASIANGGGSYLRTTQVVNYFELHDEAWSLSGGERAVVTIDPTGEHDSAFARGRTNVAQGWTMLSPGIPAFLMGAEFLADSPFEQEKLDWGELAENPGVFEFYKDLIALRTGSDAFDADRYHRIAHVNESADVVTMHRRASSDFNTPADEYLVVINLSDTDRSGYAVGVPTTGQWVEVLNSEDPAYQGDGPVNAAPVATTASPLHNFGHTTSVDLPARSITVFAPAPAAPCVADINTSNTNPGDASYGSPDGQVDGADLSYFVENWLGQNAAVADVNASNTNPGDPGYGSPDGAVDGADLSFFVENWLAGCP